MGKGNVNLPVRAAEHEQQPEAIESWTIEDVVKELLSLYHFLTWAYVSKWRLRTPPASGWPQITPERFAALKKERIAIELLKHIPYLRDEDGSSAMIWTACCCIDYAGLSLQSHIVDFQDISQAEDIMLQTDDNDPDYRRLTSHHIVLGNVTCRDGTALIFDTRDGTVIETCPMFGTWEIHDSMEALVQWIKHCFVKTRIMPIDTITLVSEWDTHESSLEPVRDILASHAWPKKAYKKLDYLQAVEKADLSSNGNLEYFTRRNGVETLGNANYKVQHVASQLKTFYQLLIRLYLPADMLRVPPHNGWESVSRSSLWTQLPSLNKEAYNLLKHLPYLRQDLQDTTATMMDEDCICVDYSGQLLRSGMIDQPGATEKPLVPVDLGPDKIVLATAGDRHTAAITFDLLTGSIEKVSKEEHLSFPNIDAFVEHMTNAFLNLEVVPLDRATVKRVSSRHSLKCKEVAEKSGWPGNNYDKSQCLATLQHLRST